MEVPRGAAGGVFRHERFRRGAALRRLPRQAAPLPGTRPDPQRQVREQRLRAVPRLAVAGGDADRERPRRRTRLPALHRARPDDPRYRPGRGQLPRRRDLCRWPGGRRRERDAGGLVPLRKRVATARERDDPTPLRLRRDLELVRVREAPSPCLLAARLRPPDAGEQHRAGVQRPSVGRWLEVAHQAVRDAAAAKPRSQPQVASSEHAFTGGRTT